MKHSVQLLSFFLLLLAVSQPCTMLHAESKDAAEGGEKAAIIPIEGEIDKFQVIFLRRSIEKAKEAGAQTIIFSINTFGGRVDSALQMATLIGSLNEIHTVAYIPAEPESIGVSWSAGALISFSCNAIYMAPGTSIGAAAPVFQSAEGTKAAGEKTVSAVRSQLEALAEKNGYPREIAVAMVDMDAELIEISRNGSYRFELNGTNAERDETAAENGQDIEDGGRQTAGGEEKHEKRRVISPKGKLLTLTAGDMEKYGISGGTVSNSDELLNSLGLREALSLRPTNADKAVGFLTSAAVTSLLLTLGLLGLYLEISSPGFGVPGTIAILAFATIFFSSGLLGTLGSVELILFILGLGLLVVEIFLIPGFGVAGITGLLFMSTGLILSRQGFILPESDWQWDLFLQNIGVVFGTFALSFILLGILMIFFPKIRLFRRLILSTPSGSLPSGENLSAAESIGSAGQQSAAEHKNAPTAGSTGRAKTTLRPAGTAVIDGEYYSVVTQGEWIETGAEIRVCELAGNRIVVERT